MLPSETPVHPANDPGRPLNRRASLGDGSTAVGNRLPPGECLAPSGNGCTHFNRW